ncbi:MAG: chloride channel protein, partial [Anaerolineae bacterium]
MSRKDAKKRRVRPANRFRAVFLDLLALLLGVIVSGTAVLFHALLALVHNLAFLGKWSFSSDISQHTPDSPWGVWLFLVPALVALIVAYLVKVIPEVKGAGVPDVLDAIYYRQAKIRPIVAVVRPLATSLTIGSGGSAGHEGPIAHIGATLG